MKAIQKILQTLLFTGMTLLSFNGLSQTYQVVWADEFDGTGTGINGISGDWGYRIGGGQPNNEQEVYTNSNHFIQNGMCHIQARVEPNGSITSACFTTQHKKFWTYGKIEIRCALPGFQGSWPSMFSLGESIDQIGWPACGETDIFEQLNGSGTIYGTIHYNNNGHQQNQGRIENPSIKSLHTYTVEWAPNSIKWFLDGVQYHSANTSGIDAYNHNFFILVNLAVGGDFPGQNVDRSALPADYIIDYVRVSQLCTNCVDPTVSITAPVEGSTYDAPANITITANATPAGTNTINRVDFYNGTTLIGTDLTSPYSFSWSGVDVGNYTLTAKATDNAGHSKTSNPVHVTVQVPRGPNLALAKTTATSTNETAALVGANAVDGNLTTRWASAFADPQWISVDLGANYDVSAVKITWEAAFGKNYSIQLSNDATNWTTIKTVTNNATLVNDNTGLTGNGRYVRIYGTARGTAYGYSIYELEVYGSSCVIPAQPGAITGNTSVVAGSSQTYSVGVVSGATSYTWTLPAGWTGTSTTNSITTTVGAASGTISVKANNACGSSAATSLAVTVTCTIPAQPGAITGNATVDAGSSQTYSVGTVSGATSYTWTLPAGWTGTSTTNSITTTAGTAGGTISVKANNACGSSAATAMTVTVNAVSNLALNKTTAVSSTETAAYPGSLAVDGNLATRWSSAFADPQWISVDLGASYDVNRVKITWEAASAKNYLIQVSNDNVNWTTIKTITGNATLVNDNTGLVGAGRYIRMYGSARNTAYGYSIFELEVYGTPTVVSANLAFNKITTTSSTETAAYPGSAAVDGNATTTRWSSLFADPQWISVDLGASYNVNRVKITWEAASAKNYVIQTSNDNTNWTTIKTITGNATLINDNTGLVGTGRYVRMYGTARNTAYGYSIYEMEVYGTAAGRMAVEDEPVNHVSVYPVPLQDILTINIPKNTYHEANVINVMSGNVEAQRSIQKDETEVNLGVGHLAKGVYILILKNNNGKLVKQKLLK